MFWDTIFLHFAFSLIENAKCKKLVTQNIQELQDTMRRPNLRIISIEERISDAEDTIENIDSTIKERAKCIKLVIQNIQAIQYTMKRPNLRIIGID